MPHDAAFAERIRKYLSDRSDVTEMDMMGGHQFLVSGKICVSVRGDTMSVRVDPAERDRLLAQPNVRALIMGTRTTKGFVRIPLEELRADRKLAEWVQVGLRGVAHR